MASISQPQEGRDRVLPTLDVFIQVLNIAKDACGIPPAQIAFGSASVLLAMIRDTMANYQDYVELGRTCGDVCQVLYRRLEGRRLDGLNQPVIDAIGNLTTTVAEIHIKVVKQGKRSAVFRFILAKGDRDKIAAWKQDLVRVLHVFNTELIIDTNTMVADTQTMVADMHRNMLAEQEGAPGVNHLTQARLVTLNPIQSVVSHFHSTPLGELPPPAPRDFFGRDELIEKLVGFVESLESIALIGAGGIGKTSVALTVLHHSRIEERFGENRRFIRCDEFPASRAHFLVRLSEVLGAGVENPKDLTPLRPLLSSKDMVIILDNAESILDPKGSSAREIHSVVDELCQFKRVCIFITSRITTVPPRCKRPEIPTLSMEAACDIFYGTFGDGRRSNTISDLLKRLDFHALSIKLLATTASHNGWDHDRLAEEWDAQRAQVLQTDYNESLAATIELSLTSPTFHSLGPNARDLLGLVAFFPQGISEKNLHWLFPSISDRKNIFDKFSLLSLTYRSNGFVTMLAPIRHYLSPQDPLSSPILLTTRDHYFNRLSIDVSPGNSGYEDARWIALEDMNVEHLLDVSTPIDQTEGNVWDASYHFMRHLYWHKPRQTILRSKIEALPDDHHSKPKCLFALSLLFGRVGNRREQKRLLTHALGLERQRGNHAQVAETLRYLSGTNRILRFCTEGTQQAKEALEIYERIDDAIGQAQSWNSLAWALSDSNQLDAAEKAASRAIDLTPEKGQEHLLCSLHRVLGRIYHSKGEEEKAIHYFKTVLKIASPFNWQKELFWAHYSLACLFAEEDELAGANAHIKLAKEHAAHDPYKLAHAMRMQARFWYLQDMLEDAKSEASQALEIYERLGVAKFTRTCRAFLRQVEMRR